MASRFDTLFPTKPVLGVVYLQQDCTLSKARNDLRILHEAGLNGAIIHLSPRSEPQLRTLAREIQDPKFPLGLYYKGDPDTFQLVVGSGCVFTRFNYVGSYARPPSMFAYFESERSKFPCLPVFATAEPTEKPRIYRRPERAILESIAKTDAIVIEGKNALQEIEVMRHHGRDHPLLVEVTGAEDISLKFKRSNGLILAGNYCRINSTDRSKINSTDRIRPYNPAALKTLVRKLEKVGYHPKI